MAPKSALQPGVDELITWLCPGTKARLNAGRWRQLDKDARDANIIHDLNPDANTQKDDVKAKLNSLDAGVIKKLLDLVRNADDGGCETTAPVKLEQQSAPVQPAVSTGGASAMWANVAAVPTTQAAPTNNVTQPAVSTGGASAMWGNLAAVHVAQPAVSTGGASEIWSPAVGPAVAEDVDNDVISLQQQIESLKVSEHDLQSENLALVVKVQHLEEKIKAVQTRYDEVKSTSFEDYDKTLAEIARLQGQVKSYHSQLVHYKQQCADSKFWGETLLQKLKDLVKIADERQAVISRLRQELLDKDAKISIMQHTIDVLQKEQAVPDNSDDVIPKAQADRVLAFADKASPWQFADMSWDQMLECSAAGRTSK